MNTCQRLVVGLVKTNQTLSKTTMQYLKPNHRVSADVKTACEKDNQFLIHLVLISKAAQSGFTFAAVPHCVYKVRHVFVSYLPLKIQSAIAHLTNIT